MSDPYRIPDRIRCALCGHSRGSHDGKLPGKCSLRDCTCPAFTDPREVANA